MPAGAVQEALPPAGRSRTFSPRNRSAFAAKFRMWIGTSAWSFLQTHFRLSPDCSWDPVELPSPTASQAPAILIWCRGTPILCRSAEVGWRWFVTTPVFAGLGSTEGVYR